MYSIHWRKIIIILCVLISLGSRAQHAVELNLPNHDYKKYYFGIVLGYNRANYSITHDSSFIGSNLTGNRKIYGIQSSNFGRVHLGIMANYQLSERFDIRFYPLNLIFSDYKIYLFKKINSDSIRFGSIVMNFPLQVRLKSDRINNFRVYSLAGVKYGFELSSNSKSGGEDGMESIKIKNNVSGIEAGIGFQFFLPYFILSPEIKVSFGTNNLHIKDAASSTPSASTLIDKINSRMIMLSLHFEGGGKD